MAYVRRIEDDSPSRRDVRYRCPEDIDLRDWFRLLKFKPPVDVYDYMGRENPNHVDSDGRIFLERRWSLEYQGDRRIKH